ncbi:MAG: succinate dehydrogenase cytochrome b subunit [Bacteroidales bacterium]|nr:succinate dehydrogenase cytochrome b subunit [Bacteroidales bacterium]
MSNIFRSSIGRKLLMSLAGLFLCTFLLVHLGINLLLILFESSKPFNIAANFMASNILIKVFEIILFGGLLIHIFFGLFLQIQNWIARPVRYKKNNNSQTSFFSKYMIHTAAIVLAFMVIHLLDFYFKSKFFGEIDSISYDGGLTHMHDMGALVTAKFGRLDFVIIYIVSFIFLGFHLYHAFQSAFQTLGLNHKVYTPVIKFLGVAYTFIIVLGFTSIPVVIYFIK